MFEGSLDTSDIFLTNFGNSDSMLKKNHTSIEGGMECIDRLLTNNAYFFI